MNLKNMIGKTYWFDLPATDTIDARSFYEGLFDWKFLRLGDDRLSDYWAIQAGEELIGGLRQTADSTRAAAAPVIYFTVDNIDAYASRVCELGGTLVGERIDLGKNRGSYQWFRDRAQNLVALWAPERQ